MAARLGMSRFLDPAIADLNATSHAIGNPGIVRHHNQGRAAFAVQRQQQPDDVLRRLAVEVAGGFVRQQQRGFADKGAGYRDTLALAARHIGGSMVAAVAQADALQLRQGSLAGLRLGMPR